MVKNRKSKILSKIRINTKGTKQSNKSKQNDFE